MVNSTDLVILALGGLLTVAFLYRDQLPFLARPSQKTAAPVKAPAAGANGGYQGDVRDFATRMRDQVRCRFSLGRRARRPGRSGAARGGRVGRG